MLIVRENTECLMVGKETMDEAKGKAVAERVITRTASERVARTAFLQAKTRFLQAQDALEHQSKFTASALTLRYPAALLSLAHGVLYAAFAAPLSNGEGVANANVVRPPRVTVVHKANVLPLTDGLFLSSALKVAKAFPDVALEEQVVDTVAYNIVRDPSHFDVLLGA